jgi:hypothetical protein
MGLRDQARFFFMEILFFVLSNYVDLLFCSWKIGWRLGALEWAGLIYRAS